LWKSISCDSPFKGGVYRGDLKERGRERWWVEGLTRGRRDSREAFVWAFVGTTEYTEWQWPLSGIHSLLRVKLPQPGEGPFILSTITYKVMVYAPAERADTLPLFFLYPYINSVVNPL
jgi:hypothetical protein